MNYKERMKREVRRLAKRHYEPGNRMRCYKAVWRFYVYPRTGICYRTFLNYLKE